MGKLLILTKYIFLIYGSDINELRRHIHVTYTHRGDKKSCKFWMEPEVKLDDGKTGDFSQSELNEICKLVIEHKDLILQQLDLFYKQQPVKAIRK